MLLKKLVNLVKQTQFQGQPQQLAKTFETTGAEMKYLAGPQRRAVTFKLTSHNKSGQIVRGAKGITLLSERGIILPAEAIT